MILLPPTMNSPETPPNCIAHPMGERVTDSIPKVAKNSHVIHVFERPCQSLLLSQISLNRYFIPSACQNKVTCSLNTILKQPQIISLRHASVIILKFLKQLQIPKQSLLGNFWIARIVNSLFALDKKMTVRIKCPLITDQILLLCISQTNDKIFHKCRR